MAIRTNPVFIDAYMDEGNESAFKQVYEALFKLKGVLLIGSIGSGKTYLMSFLAAALGQIRKGFNILQTDWITRDCLAKPEMINHYGRESFYDTRDENGKHLRKPITYCFDDLGLERVETKIYGNSLSVMTDILIDRHIMFTKCGMKTHATSNLSVEKLAERYGDRSASRFAEMFNVVILTGNDRRK